MSMDLEQFLHDALDRVEHTTSIEAFFHRFEVIKSLVSSSQPWLPESYFASRFVYGLQEAFQLFVLRFHPTTIQAAYRLALIYEESIYLQYFPELVCQNVDLYEDNSDTEILLVSPIVERASEVIMSEYLSSESDTVVDSLGTNLKEDSAIAVDGFVITNQIQDTPETVELVAQQHKNLMSANMVQQHSISTCEDVHHMGSRVGCVQSYVVRDCNADEESVGMSPDNDFLHTFKATGVNALDTSFAEIDITNVEWKIAIGSKGLKSNWDCRFPEGLSHQDPAEITNPASQPHNSVARCLCDSPELFAEGLNIGDSMGGSGVDGFHKTITPVTYKQSSCSNRDWFLSISVVGEVADFMMLPNSILEMAVEVDAVHTYVYALEVLSSANQISSKYPSSVQSLSFRAAEVVAISEEFSDEDKTTTGFHVILSDPFTHTVRTIYGLDNQLVEDNVYSDVVWVHKSECFALQHEWWLLLYPENFIQLNQSSIFLAFKGGTCQLPNLSYLDSCCRGSSGNLSPDSVWASAVRGVLLMPIFFIFSRCAMAATSHSVGHFLYAVMIFDSNEMLFSMFLILRLLLYDSCGCTQHPIVFIFGTMNHGPELCFLSSCLAWDSKEYMLSSVDASSVVARIWGDYAMLHKFKLKTLQINNVPELVFDIYFTLGTTAGTKVPTLHSKPRCIHASTLCMQTFLIQLMLLLRYMVVRKMVSTLMTVHKVLCGLMYPALVSELKWVLTMGIVICVLCLPDNLLVTFVSLLLRRVHAVVNTILLHAHSIFEELQPYTIEEANAITGLDTPTITTIRSGGRESICFGYQRQWPHASIICLSFYMFVFHLSVSWFLHTLKNFHSIFIYSDCQLLLCVVDSSQEQLSVGEYSGGSTHSIRSKWCCGLGGSIISAGFTWSCQAFLTWTELDYFLLSFCWMTLRILPQSFVKVTHINHKTALNVDSDGATFGIFCLVIPMGMSGFGLCLSIFPAYWKLLVQIKIDVMRVTQERSAAVNASIIARKTNHNMPEELVYSFRTISKKSFLHG